MSQDSLGSSFQFSSPSSQSTENRSSAGDQHRHSGGFKNRRMSGHDFVRSHVRDIHDSRARESRSSLLDRFRNISLSGSADNGVELDNDSIGDDNQMNDDVFDTSLEDNDDWGDPTKDIPSVDLRMFNFHIPGILCPYCRSNMMAITDQKERLAMKSEMGAVMELTISHLCPCGFELQVNKTCEEIKQNIMNVLQQHELVCHSNQSPHYTLYSSNIVLSCTLCKLAQIVS